MKKISKEETWQKSEKWKDLLQLVKESQPILKKIVNQLE